MHGETLFALLNSSNDIIPICSGQSSRRESLETRLSYSFGRVDMHVCGWPATSRRNNRTEADT